MLPIPNLKMPFSGVTFSLFSREMIIFFLAFQRYFNIRVRRRNVISKLVGIYMNPRNSWRRFYVNVNFKISGFVCSDLFLYQIEDYQGSMWEGIIQVWNKMDELTIFTLRSTQEAAYRQNLVKYRKIDCPKMDLLKCTLFFLSISKSHLTE